MTFYCRRVEVVFNYAEAARWLTSALQSRVHPADEIPEEIQDITGELSGDYRAESRSLPRGVPQSLTCRQDFLGIRAPGEPIVDMSECSIEIARFGRPDGRLIFAIQIAEVWDEKQQLTALDKLIDYPPDRELPHTQMRLFLVVPAAKPQASLLISPTGRDAHEDVGCAAKSPYIRKLVKLYRQCYGSQSSR